MKEYCSTNISVKNWKNCVTNFSVKKSLLRKISVEKLEKPSKKFKKYSANNIVLKKLLKIQKNLLKNFSVKNILVNLINPLKLYGGGDGKSNQMNIMYRRTPFNYANMI